MRFPLSSHRLRNRRLQLSNSSSEETGTLLPFFDERGIVQRVMVLSAASSDVRFFDPAEADVRVPLWGVIRLSQDSSVLRLLEDEDPEQLFKLWHYDPWRLLTARPELTGERVRRLKETNCAGRFAEAAGSVGRLIYARNLRRLRWLVCTKGQSTSWKRFRPELLPPRAPSDSATQSTVHRYAWRLAPFWGGVPEKR